jgi:hypothetical protein
LYKLSYSLLSHQSFRGAAIPAERSRKWPRSKWTGEAQKCAKTCLWLDNCCDIASGKVIFFKLSWKSAYRKIDGTKAINGEEEDGVGYDGNQALGEHLGPEDCVCWRLRLCVQVKGKLNFKKYFFCLGLGGLPNGFNLFILGIDSILTLTLGLAFG